MRTFIAAVVTWDDLKTYFGKGSVWKRTDIRDDRMSGSSRYFSYDVEPKEVVFAYRVEAVDDPSDSEEGTSPEPLKDIAKFLGQGLPGGEFFEKRSSGPDYLAALLRVVAAAAIETKSRSGISRMLRRAAVLPHLGAAVSALRPHLVRIAMSEADAFEKLKKDMEAKGWDVEEGKNEVGSPKLTIDVGGQYKAEIEVDSITYDYVFQFADRPDLTKSGTTEDPIREFQKFYKSPEVSEAEDELAASEKEKAEEAPPESFMQTVPAGKKPGPGPEPGQEEKGTMPAGKRPGPEFGEEKTMPARHT